MHLYYTSVFGSNFGIFCTLNGVAFKFLNAEFRSALNSNHSSHQAYCLWPKLHCCLSLCFQLSCQSSRGGLWFVFLMSCRTVEQIPLSDENSVWITHLNLRLYFAVKECELTTLIELTNSQFSSTVFLPGLLHSRVSSNCSSFSN